MNVLHTVGSIVLWIFVLAGGVVVLVAGKVLLDLATKEVTGQIDRLPTLILKLALLRLPADQRERYADDWQPELTHILKELDSRPISRLLQGLWFSTSLLLRARTMRKALGVSGRKPSTRKTITDLLMKIAIAALLATAANGTFGLAEVLGLSGLLGALVSVAVMGIGLLVPSAVLRLERKRRRRG